MSLKIGDVEVAPQIIDSEFRIATLEKLLQFIIDNNQGKLVLPNQPQVDRIGREVLSEMKRKYPNMGLELK